ncbi:MAG: hypothetical protein A3D92_19920 [Bacteroidetes bacterium RIFCSPHIGHO2_02_FULL_44_7]|nr:MAG: hypothetical protein A3D92_19920 [Bacteroidetes bacterium RIFCSPHIGHO2_02_FULL_44_7]
MKEALKNIASLKVFLLISWLFIAFGAFFLLTHDKSLIHLAINHYHSAILDLFFKFFTHVGDGITTSIAVLPITVWLYKKHGLSTLLLGALTLIFAGILAQVLKTIVYPDALRPIAFLHEVKLYLIPGVEVHSAHSFPSGHTTAAFAFFLFFTYTCFRKRWGWQVFCALCAVGVGYSRMYLSQHFLEDVLSGAILGQFAFLIALFLTRLLPNQKNIARKNLGQDF